MAEETRRHEIASKRVAYEIPGAEALPVRKDIAYATLNGERAYLLDCDGATSVVEAARTFGFSNPGAGRSIEEMRSDVPLLIVRAGQDAMPGLNASGDRFVAKALDRNLPLTVVNHHTGPHAFDLFDASHGATLTIRQVLMFLQQHT